MDLMMPIPRKQLISVTDTPYYHCISRCIRRTFLCGKDELTGKNFEHRREWIEEKLTVLNDVFAIDISDFKVGVHYVHFCETKTNNQKKYRDKFTFFEVKIALRYHRF